MSNKSVSINHAQFLLEHNFKLILHVETKANMILAIVGVTLSITSAAYLKIPGNTFMTISFVIFVLSCFLSAIFSLLTIKAKIGFDEPDNFIHFLYLSSSKCIVNLERLINIVCLFDRSRAPITF